MDAYAAAVIGYYVQELPAYSRLPREYMECAYCYTTGQTYIDTGLTASAQDEYICRVRKTSTSTNQPFIGDGVSKTNANLAVWVNDMSGSKYNVEFSFGNGNVAANNVDYKNSEFDTHAWHTYRMSLVTGEAYVDDQYRGTATVASFSSESTSRKLTLFSGWRAGAPNGYFIGEMAESVFKRNGSVIRHFIPCVRSDGVSGFYDLCGSTSPKTLSPFYAGESMPAISSSRFIFDERANVKFEVSIDAPNTTVQFNTLTPKGTDLMVDWGDGETTACDANNKSHTYALAGTYLVRIQSVAELTLLKTSGMNVRRAWLRNISSIFNSMFENDSSMTLPSGLPDTVTSIGNYSFKGCRSLRQVTIPPGVTTIGTYAFSGCTGLTGVVFQGTPSSTISSTDFNSCENLSNIYVPWSEGDVDNAPWGATSATIHYDSAT